MVIIASSPELSRELGWIVDIRFSSEISILILEMAEADLAYQIEQEDLVMGLNCLEHVQLVNKRLSYDNRNRK